MNAALIITGIAIFVFGVVTGVVLIASIGIQREEREFRRTGAISVTRPALDRVSQRTRSLVGVGSASHAR